MPFTLAHPAAAVPLLRPLGRYGSLSALVIGSIAPDLGFFVPLGFTREQTHGLAALLLFCLPAGMLTYLLFHLTLKASLLSLAPQYMLQRLGSVAADDLPQRTWAAVTVSLLIGAVTHLLWDAFTHPGTPAVAALPVLQTRLASVGGYHVYVYKLLQHGGTVLGLALLARTVVRWLRCAPVQSLQPAMSLSLGLRWSAALALTVLPALAGIWAGVRRSPDMADLLNVQAFAAGFIFTALPVFALVLVSYSLLWQVKRALSSGR